MALSIHAFDSDQLPELTPMRTLVSCRTACLSGHGQPRPSSRRHSRARFSKSVQRGQHLNGLVTRRITPDVAAVLRRGYQRSGYRVGDIVVTARRVIDGVAAIAPEGRRHSRHRRRSPGRSDARVSATFGALCCCIIRDGSTTDVPRLQNCCLTMRRLNMTRSGGYGEGLAAVCGGAPR